MDTYRRVEPKTTYSFDCKHVKCPCGVVQLDVEAQNQCHACGISFQKIQIKEVTDNCPVCKG